MSHYSLLVTEAGFMHRFVQQMVYHEANTGLPPDGLSANANAAVYLPAGTLQLAAAVT